LEDTVTTEQKIAIFKQLNAPVGELGRASLVWSNRSVTSTEKVYARFLNRIGQITQERDELVGQIKTLLNAAAFNNQPVDEGAENSLSHRAQALVNRVKDLAEHDRDKRRAAKPPTTRLAGQADEPLFSA
jgi:hypothetical protein